MAQGQNVTCGMEIVPMEHLRIGRVVHLATSIVGHWGLLLRCLGHMLAMCTLSTVTMHWGRGATGHGNDGGSC